MNRLWRLPSAFFFLTTAYGLLPFHSESSALNVLKCSSALLILSRGLAKSVIVSS